MTALRVPEPSAPALDDRPVPAVWVITADARTSSLEARERLAAELRASGARGRTLVLETCHRVERYGVGLAPTSFDVPDASGARVLAESDAVRHLMRVAAGLESAVVGEDQVLAQLRRASDALRDGPSDPALHRLVQCALGVGRRVRRGRRPRERGLAIRALAWLAPRIGGLEGRRILVAGAGDMGTAVALAAVHRGAHVTVVTQRPRRLPAGLRAVDLESGARLAAHADGLVVALGGPWSALADVADPLPPIVDLSSPRAVPPTVATGVAVMDVDALFAQAGAGHADAEFIARAEAEVEIAVQSFERWVAARPSADAARRLNERGRRRAAARADAALRRLPGLTDREREVVRRVAELVAADLLHEPLARLGADADGRAREATRELFEL